MTTITQTTSNHRRCSSCDSANYVNRNNHITIISNEKDSFKRSYTPAKQSSSIHHNDDNITLVADEDDSLLQSHFFSSILLYLESVYDKYSLAVKLENKGNTARDHLGQIIFNSNNYSFPPDILFHQLPKEVTEIIDDTKVLLPSEDWDLYNEECLYLWVQRILETIIKEPPVVENDKEKYMKGFFSDDDDVFEDGKKGDKQKKTSSVLDTKSKGEEEEPKIKRTWSIFKEIDDELDIFEEIKKDNLDEKQKKRVALPM
ncbi:unnamed protein product [Mucor hiemalis]